MDVASPSDHSVSFAVTPPCVPWPVPASARGTRSCPAPSPTTASLPRVPLPSLLAGSTSPPRTRCGWGRGGSASWGLELPPCSSPSPSWATPSASQVRGSAAARELGLGLLPLAVGACTLMHGCSWGLGSKGTASRVIPKWISPPWLSVCRCYGFSLAAVGGGRMSRCSFPLQIHCFSSTRIPWLACSSTLFASHFQDPSATSL